MLNRIENCFAELRAHNRPALISYIMAGDPDIDASENLLMKLPAAGIDIIELGIPFSDPTADGAVIQEAAIRSLKSGTTIRSILEMVKGFRYEYPNMPVVLMGYYNPIMQYGAEKFSQEAADAGVDGVIIVDLPPEEESEITPYLEEYDIAFIRLIAPTTDDARLEKILDTATGFVYTIAIKGITGTRSADNTALIARIEHIKRHTNLPVVAGFGIKSSEQVKEIKNVVDGVVIGSAIIKTFIEEGEQAAIDYIEGISETLKEQT